MIITKQKRLDEKLNQSFVNFSHDQANNNECKWFTGYNYKGGA